MEKCQTDARATDKTNRLYLFLYKWISTEAAMRIVYVNCILEVAILS